MTEPHDSLPPRDVFVGTCAELTEGMADLGFRFFKSSPKMARTVDGWRQEISFWSSHNNVRGEYVELTGNIHSRSTKMATWAKTLPCHFYTTPGLVALGGLGRFLPEPRWKAWNLEPAETRAATTQEILAHLRERVMPLFDLCRDPDRLFDQLAEADIEGIAVRAAMLYAIFLKRPEDAVRIAERQMRESPELRTAAAELVAREATPEELMKEATTCLLAGLPLLFSVPLDLA